MSEVKMFDPEKDLQPIQLTAEAARYFKKEVEKHNALGLRLGVKKAGCSGFKYVVDFVQTAESDDQQYQQENGLQVFVNAQSRIALSGVTVDYVKEGLNHRIKFINPNEKASCGCGESFSV